VSAASAAEDGGGWSPFVVFGIAAVVAAAFAIYMGVSFLETPDFLADDFPTIAGVTIAVVLFVVLGARAPPNE
jgi:prolipoprotein diacylglyceryltransferase